MEQEVTMLRVENVWKKFGSLHVLQGAGLSVAAGERHAIIGPNGAGKTTFFNVITGLLQPDTGKIVLGNKDITGLAPHKISLMGLARTFQVTNLLLNLTAFENVRLAVQSRFGALYKPLTPVEHIPEIREKTEATLCLMNLEDEMHEQAGQLSYGAQRQLEIAVALGVDPTVLLLDEPTAGMSPAETERVVKLVNGLPRSITIVFVDHDMDVVFSVAETLTVLHTGCVIAQGDKETVRCVPEVMDAYLGNDRSNECLLS
jgi:branched-chain amino acid transport system ATP-binding protein